MSPIDTWLAEHAAQVIAWRRDLHAHPELSRAEHRSTDLVMAVLTDAGLSPRRLPAGTGVVCDIGPAPRIAFRADMDALPMDERTGLPYSSTVAGVSHSCGHDAHTAILMGVGVFLAAQSDLPVGVRLIFQAAEEVMPGGALDAIAAGVTSDVSRIFSLHCDPKLMVGQVGIREGAITSAADFIEVEFSSPGGHTSRPHLTGDVVNAMGTVITGLPAVLSRRVDPSTGSVMVWGAAHAGNAPNAIPQGGTLRGTVRTADHATWDLLEPLVTEIVDGLVRPLGVNHELTYRRGVPPVVNDAKATAILRAAVAAVHPDAPANTRQSGGAEDYSWYLEKVPGTMGRLGVWSGSGPAVDIHQPNFDLDERALAVGIATFARIALDY